MQPLISGTLELGPKRPLTGETLLRGNFLKKATANMESRIGVPIAPYATSDRTSFASISARDRWPVIVVSMATERVGGKLTAQDRSHR